MNSRRDFLWKLGGLLVIVPVGVSVAGCSSSDDDDDGDCAMANTVVSTATTLTVTSVCNQHTHDYSIAVADLTSPPATGEAGMTTPYADDGHVHTVTLSMSDLASIQSGSTVMSTTSTDVGHNHVFMFRKTQ